MEESLVYKIKRKIDIVENLAMKKLEDIFKGVASHRRIQILKLLFPDKEFNVGEIADQIGLSFRSTSKHLIKLEKSGFLQSQQEGFWKKYWLNPGPPEMVKKVIELVNWHPG